MAEKRVCTFRSLIHKKDCPPLVFRNAIWSWPCCRWTVEYLAKVLGSKSFTCKIADRHCEEYEWESDCLHLEITLQQYADWLQRHADHDNPLCKVDAANFSCYIDYKYMKDMFKDNKEHLQAVCWDVFGLDGRDGEHSTIWIGSEGVYTPCHQDTYGFNLVAQIQGRKRWYLFPPSQSGWMYSTRIPYEESSIYSTVDIRYPDLSIHRKFKNTTPYVIELNPGEVLYVPRHWWHFVESLESSISINTWVPVVDDVRSHLYEALSRLLFSSLTASLPDQERDSYINSGEELESSAVNLQYVKICVEEHLGRSLDCTSRRSEGLKGSSARTVPIDFFDKFCHKFMDHTLMFVDISEGIDTHGICTRYRKRKISLENYCDSSCGSLKTDKNIGSEGSSSNPSAFCCKHVKTQSTADYGTASDNVSSTSFVKIDTLEDEHESSCETKDKKCCDERKFAQENLQADDCLIDQLEFQSDNVQILAAKCLTFSDFIKFLQKHFDYDLSYEGCHEKCTTESPNKVTPTDSDLGQQNMFITTVYDEHNLSTSSYQETTKNVAAGTFSETVVPEDHIEVKVTVPDIINSILDPGVIRHIAGVLLSKYNSESL